MSKRKKNRATSPKKAASPSANSKTAKLTVDPASPTPNEKAGSEKAGSESKTAAKPSKAAKAKHSGAKSQSNKASSFLLDRRKLLLIGLSVPAVAIGGTMLHRYDVRTKTEHDLTAIGQGQPVVVQIHDPGCPMCRRLMRNARAALPETPELLYRVANIKTAKGAQLQKRHGVPHVTLLLFNGEGELQDTLQGITPTADLVTAFRALMKEAQAKQT